MRIKQRDNESPNSTAKCFRCQQWWEICKMQCSLDKTRVPSQKFYVLRVLLFFGSCQLHNYDMKPQVPKRTISNWLWHLLTQSVKNTHQVQHGFRHEAGDYSYLQTQGGQWHGIANNSRACQSAQWSGWREGHTMSNTVSLKAAKLALPIVSFFWKCRKMRSLLLWHGVLNGLGFAAQSYSFCMHHWCPISLD